MYLLDTNVISELRKIRPHGGVHAWLQSVNNHDLFLSAVSLGELQAGVELTRKQDAQKATLIEEWVEQLAASYQILSMDAHVFRTWARLMNGQPQQILEDAMIAATAQVHHLTVVTRNIKDFQKLDVPVFNPFTFVN
jgi:predicted nucleic acid-binding protein